MRTLVARSAIHRSCSPLVACGYGKESAGGPRARTARASSHAGAVARREDERARSTVRRAAAAAAAGRRRCGAPTRARGAGRRAAPPAASESASRIGIALRCTGPSRHIHQCMCMPARAWIQVSSAAKASSEPTAEHERVRAEARKARRGAGPGAESSACRSRTPSAASQSTPQREQRAATASATNGDHRAAAGRRAGPRAASASPRRPARGRRGPRARARAGVPRDVRDVSSHPQRKRQRSNSLPPCVTWRNSRHVPVAGSSTPSSSAPGFVL